MQLIFVITGILFGSAIPSERYFKDILSADFSETLVTRVLQTRKTHRSSQITYRFHVLSPCVKLKLNKLLDKRYRSLHVSILGTNKRAIFFHACAPIF